MTAAGSAGIKTGPAAVEVVRPKSIGEVQKTDLKRIAFIMLGLCLIVVFL